MHLRTLDIFMCLSVLTSYNFVCVFTCAVAMVVAVNLLPYCSLCHY